jgi:photosystem II stability/assembly factor-like uncharacterized protein
MDAGSHDAVSAFAPRELIAASPTDLWATVGGEGEGRVTAEQVVVSHDGGETWSDVSPPRELLHGEALRVGSLAALARQAWLVLSEAEAPGGDEHPKPVTLQLLRTVNGGGTWVASRVTAGSTGRPLESLPPAGVALDFASPSSGWMAVEWQHGMSSMANTLFVTRDGGATFRRVAEAPTSGIPYAAGAGNLVLVGRGGSTGPTEVHVSSDGGRSWRPSQGPFADVTSGGLDRPGSVDTYDVGAFLPAPGSSVVLFGFPMVIETASPTKILRSDDHGVRFRIVGSVVGADPFRACGSAEALWLVAGGDAFALFRSHDHGAAWERVVPRLSLPLPGAVESLRCVGHALFALASGRLFRSTDEGDTFLALPPFAGRER